jgi:hypothetical protein
MAEQSNNAAALNTPTILNRQGMIRGAASRIGIPVQPAGIVTGRVAKLVEIGVVTASPAG